LRRAAQGIAIAPVLHVSRLEHVGYETDQTVVSDVLGQHFQQDLVVDAVEAALDIALDEPLHAPPPLGDLVQCRVATTPLAEAMGAVAELRLIVSVEQETQRFLHELV